MFYVPAGTHGLSNLHAPRNDVETATFLRCSWLDGAGEHEKTLLQLDPS